MKTFLIKKRGDELEIALIVITNTKKEWASLTITEKYYFFLERNAWRVGGERSSI